MTDRRHHRVGSRDMITSFDVYFLRLRDAAADDDDDDDDDDGYKKKR